MKTITQAIIDEVVNDLPTFHPARHVILNLWYYRRTVQRRRVIAPWMFVAGFFIGIIIERAFLA
jgi:hypothetical protein